MEYRVDQRRDPDTHAGGKPAQNRVPGGPPGDSGPYSLERSGGSRIGRPQPYSFHSPGDGGSCFLSASQAHAERGARVEALPRDYDSPPKTDVWIHPGALLWQPNQGGRQAPQRIPPRGVFWSASSSFHLNHYASCHSAVELVPTAAAPDLLDTSLCSISVREKGPSWQRRTHRPRVTSSPWGHWLQGSAGASRASVRSRLSLIHI